MPASDDADPLAIWALEREIVLSRVVDAPCVEVVEAWTDPARLPQWFGPEGLAIETQEIDVRAGGRWRFAYVTPDGDRYDNRIVFLAVERGLLRFDHGPDEDDAPDRFRVTVTFDEQSDGRTVVTLRQLHPTAEQRNTTVGFGAVALGYQTLDKLAEHVRGSAG
jgi:uncharacterized protein YndB with AHSA1/START domain